MGAPSKLFKLFERLLFVLALLLIGGFVTVATLEFSYLQNYDPLSLTFYTLYAFVVLFNLFYNYIKAVITNPGRVDKLSIIDHSRDSDPICSKCNYSKPPRSHHCKYCKTCILLMDHHCPWINNCVGFHNRRYFVLFLFWCGLAVLTYFFISLVHVIKLFKGYELPKDPPLAGWVVYFTWFYSLGISLAVNGLLFTNLYLIGSGQTAIEWAQNKRLQFIAKNQNNVFHNQWNLGWRQNFIDVFGDRSVIFWPFPSRTPPRGNGMDFQSLPYSSHV